MMYIGYKIIEKLYLNTLVNNHLLNQENKKFYPNKYPVLTFIHSNWNKIGCKIKIKILTTIIILNVKNNSNSKRYYIKT